MPPTGNLPDFRKVRDDIKELIKNKPDKEATIPDIVGRVAFDIPAAIARAFEEPVIAITSKTSTIPVTVPSKPNKGAAATSVLI